MLIKSCKIGYLNGVKGAIKLEPDLLNNYTLNSCLYLMSISENITIDVLQFLIEHGADINTHRNILLRSSVRLELYDIVKYALERGADVHTKNEIVLKQAIINNNIDIIKLLFEYGADINKINEDDLLYGDKKTLKLLDEYK